MLDHIISLIAALLYPVAPLLMLRFYQNEKTADLLNREVDPLRLENIPLTSRVLCLLMGFFVLALYMMLTLNGLVPVFGVMLSGLQGTAVIAGMIVLLSGLIWGLLRERRFAWWGSLALALLTTIKHGVTRFRITLDCFEAEYVAAATKTSSPGPMRWVRPQELADIPLSATGRKIATLIAAHDFGSLRDT